MGSPRIHRDWISHLGPGHGINSWGTDTSQKYLAMVENQSTRVEACQREYSIVGMTLGRWNTKIASRTSGMMLDKDSVPEMVFMLKPKLMESPTR